MCSLYYCWYHLNTRKTQNISDLSSRLENLHFLAFYKIVNNSVPVIDSYLLHVKIDQRNSTCSKFWVFKENFRFALACFCAKNFNELPNHVNLSHSVVPFKNAARSYILNLSLLNWLIAIIRFLCFKNSSLYIFNPCVSAFGNLILFLLIQYLCVIRIYNCNYPWTSYLVTCPFQIMNNICIME